MDIPHLRRAYERHRSQGLEILGIAFVEGDDASRKWLTGYMRDHEMGWPAVAAGETWNSGPAAAYDIHYIPFNFLIDREGKVVALDVRGAELEATIGKALAR